MFGYYVEAGKLQTGDVFLGPNEELTTLTSTWREEFPSGIDVYNFTVEEDHNYFVIANYEAFQNGAAPVLVHNANKTGDCNIDTIVKRNGGQKLDNTTDYYFFPSRRAARQAASEIAGNMGRDVKKLIKKDYTEVLKYKTNAKNIYGVESMDGKIQIRDDYLGHSAFGLPRHVNVEKNGRNFHLFY
jgi:hypothetical protein